MNLQARKLRERAANERARRGARPTRVIAVASGPTDVGRKALTTDLAVALQRSGLRVVLVGLDLALADMDLVLGRPRFAFEEAIAGRRALAETATEGPWGLRVLPAAAGVDALANLTPWQRARLWPGFAELDEEADAALIDTPAGSAAETIGVLAAADEAIVVAAPDPAAVAEAYGLVKLLVSRKPDATVRLLVNRARSRKQAHETAARIIEVASRFLGVEVDDLGFVLEVPEGARAPFVAAGPQSQAARNLAAVATRLRSRAGRLAAGSLSEAMQRIATLQAPAAQAASGSYGEGHAQAQLGRGTPPLAGGSVGATPKLVWACSSGDPRQQALTR